MDSLRSLQANQIILHDDISAIVQDQISQFDPSITSNKDDILDLLDYSKEIPQKFPQEISLVTSSLLELQESNRQYHPWENSPV